MQPVAATFPPALTPEDKEVARRDAAVLQEAKEGFADAQSLDRENRKAAYEDILFRAGEQWHAIDKMKRTLEERPALTINRMPQIVNQVIGDIRKNRPSIQCTPGDAAANSRAAYIYEGLIRSIERDSNASANAYIPAAEQAVIGGMGHWRIAMQWSSPESFDLELRIEGIPNPFAVVRDAAGLRGDGAKSRRTWVYEEMPAAEFKRRWPKAQASSWPTIKPPAAQQEPVKGGGETVTVCEYWRIEERPGVVAKMVHDRAWFDQYGRPQPPTGAETTLIDPDEEDRFAARNEGWTVVAERETVVEQVVCYLLGGDSVLAGPIVWPGQRIPIFTAKGQEVQVADVVVRHGLIRYAKDAQRLFNYARSSDAELYGLAPKVPFIIADEQIEGLEDEWAMANRSPRPYLRYRVVRDVEGRPLQGLGRPGREPPVSANPGLLAMAASADDDIKSTTGIYNASLGAPSTETSGVAIDARDRQADTGTFVYVDNLIGAIEATGRELVNVIPKIYTAGRQIRILGRDDAAEIIKLAEEPVSLDRGRYDIVVTTGPAHATARKEAAAGMLEMAKIVEPPFRVPLITRVAKAQDWHDADALSDEFRQIAAALGMPGASPPGASGAPVPVPGMPPGAMPPGAMAPPGAPPPDMAFAPRPAPAVLAPIQFPPGAAPAGFERVAPRFEPQGARG